MLRNDAKKIRKELLNKDRRGKEGLHRLLQVKCRRFKRKSLIPTLSLFKSCSLGPCFELKWGSLLWWPARSLLFKMGNHQGKVGGGVMLSIPEKRNCETIHKVGMFG